MSVFIPDGWPVYLWPAQWPDGHNISKWGCRVQFPSWCSVVCRFPPVTEMKGCPLQAASEATLPPLGELEIQEGGKDKTQVENKKDERRKEGNERGKPPRQ